MENYYEKTVVKEKTSTDNLIILLTVFFTIIISAAVLFIRYISGYFPVIYLVLWYIAYRIIVSVNIEYEYSFVDNAFYIDKIVNRRWRKRLFNASLTDFDIFAKKKSGHHDKHAEIQQRLSYITFKDAEDIFFGILQYNGKKTLVYFNADEKMIDYIKKHTDYKLKE